MLKVIIDDRAVRQALARLRSRTEDLRPVMQDIGEMYVRKIDNQFRDERDPYGTPWQPLSPKTVKRKLSQRPRAIAKILQNSGLFRSSFSYTATRDSVEIGSNRVTKKGIPLGILHQLGTRRMPKREIIPTPQRGLPRPDLREFVEIIEDHITDAW